MQDYNFKIERLICYLGLGLCNMILLSDHIAIQLLNKCHKTKKLKYLYVLVSDITNSMNELNLL